MPLNSRQKRIGHIILELADKHGTIANTLLYSRVEREFPGINGREYSDALTQLRELNLVYSFDAGYDRMHEVTREGACMLVDES